MTQPEPAEEDIRTKKELQITRLMLTLVDLLTDAVSDGIGERFDKVKSELADYCKGAKPCEDYLPKALKFLGGKIRNYSAGVHASLDAAEVMLAAKTGVMEILEQKLKSAEEKIDKYNRIAEQAGAKTSEELENWMDERIAKTNEYRKIAARVGAENPEGLAKWISHISQEVHVYRDIAMQIGAGNPKELWNWMEAISAEIERHRGVAGRLQISSKTQWIDKEKVKQREKILSMYDQFNVRSIKEYGVVLSDLLTIYSAYKKYNPSESMQDILNMLIKKKNIQKF